MPDVVKTDDLTSLFDQYNAAVKAGEFERALEFRIAEVKDEILSFIANPEGKKDFEEMSKGMTPDSYTVDHLDSGQPEVTLYLTGTFKSPDPAQAGKIKRLEFRITFLEVSGVWKMGRVTWMGDPDAVKRSPDQNFEPESNYDLGRNTSLGGRIVSVKFEKDYTLVALRVMDEETLVFLPAKADLEKSGLKTGLLVPWGMLEAEGHPHKTNPLKILAQTAKLISG